MSFMQRWQRRRDARRQARDRSAWDNPITGTDLLVVMLETKRVRAARRLP